MTTSGASEDLLAQYDQLKRALREAIQAVREHNIEYQHRTPSDVITRWEKLVGPETTASPPTREERIAQLLRQHKEHGKLLGADLKEYRDLVLQGVPLPETKWRHFRGGYYWVTGCSLHCDTLEVLVHYQCVETGMNWTRPLSKWTDNVLNALNELVPRYMQEG